MKRQVETAHGVRTALRDPINKAGEGELVGGRLEGAICDGPTRDNPYLYITIGAHRFRIDVQEAVKSAGRERS